MRLLPRLPLRRLLPWGATLAGSLWLSGCVIAPLPPPPQSPQVLGEPAGPVVVAPMAPPPMPAESIAVAPAPGYIWIGGYWGWVGGRHVWSAGHWTAPRPGYRWMPRRWSPGAGGWHQHGGYWAR
ncbi:MAG TPA: hypothetical protein VLJ57_15860 [Burkholderiaceae bacterium]|nr:hypothetical protein [Burkholderiaceae bacterium]